MFLLVQAQAKGCKKVAVVVAAVVVVLWEGPAPPRLSRDPQNRKWLWMTP